MQLKVLYSVQDPRQLSIFTITFRARDALGHWHDACTTSYPMAATDTSEIFSCLWQLPRDLPSGLLTITVHVDDMTQSPIGEVQGQVLPAGPTISAEWMTPQNGFISRVSSLHLAALVRIIWPSENPYPVLSIISVTFTARWANERRTICTVTMPTGGEKVTSKNGVYECDWHFVGADVPDGPIRLSFVVHTTLPVEPLGPQPTSRLITIASSTRERIVVWVHGLGGNARLDDPGTAEQAEKDPHVVADLRRWLGLDVQIFYYFHDRAYTEQHEANNTIFNDPCTKDPQALLKDAHLYGTYMDWKTHKHNPPLPLGSGVWDKVWASVMSSTGPAARCDSQSSLPLNVVSLAKFVEQFSHAHVTLMGQSMGGAIIRGYLAYITEMRRSDPNYAHNVDTAIIIQGAVQGSYMAWLEGQRERAPHYFNIIPGPKRLMLNVVQIAATDKLHMYPNSPAVADLIPRSHWYELISAIPVPETIHYFTFYSDMVLFDRVQRVPVGDLMMPGGPNRDDLPTSHDEYGSSRFRPPVRMMYDNHLWQLKYPAHEWSVQRTHFTTPSILGDTGPVPTPFLLNDPTNHLNLLNDMATRCSGMDNCNFGMAIRDCADPRPLITMFEQLTALIADPDHACSPQGSDPLVSHGDNIHIYPDGCTDGFCPSADIRESSARTG